jgi:hypothetical protein
VNSLGIEPLLRALGLGCGDGTSDPLAQPRPDVFRAFPIHPGAH